MTRLNDAQGIEEYDSLCVYGVSGVGKTMFAGSYGSRTLYISIGAGIRTLKSPLYRELYPTSNPLTIEINKPFVNSKGISTEVFDELTDKTDLYLTKYRDDFDVVILDDVTSLSRYANIKGMELNKKSNTLKDAKANSDIPFGDVGDIGGLQVILTWYFDTYTKIFKAEKKYFVALAHERVIFKKRETKTMMDPEPVVHKYLPLVTGKDAWAQSDFPGFFDQVWRFRMEAGVREKGKNIHHFTAITQPNTTTIAKSRLGGVFHENLKNPTLPDVIQHFKESNTIPYNKPLYTGTR